MGTTYTYTASQLATMTSAITNATADYSAGNYAAANTALVQYYQAQVTGDPDSNRGYAQAAIDVINNVGGGAVANINVENAVGAAAYTEQFKTEISLNLATADDNLIQGTPGNPGTGQMPTLAQVADEHDTVFGNMGIPIENWGGTPFEAVGDDYVNAAGYTANPAELAQIQSPNFANLSVSTITSAYNNLYSAGFSALGQLSIGTDVEGYLNMEGLGSKIDMQYGTDLAPTNAPGGLTPLGFIDNSNGTYQLVEGNSTSDTTTTVSFNSSGDPTGEVTASGLSIPSSATQLDVSGVAGDPSSLEISLQSPSGGSTSLTLSASDVLNTQVAAPDSTFSTSNDQNSLLIGMNGSTIDADGTGANILLLGSQETINTEGGTIGAIANATGMALSGTDYTLDTTGLFSGSASGTNDTLNLSGSTGSTLTLSGSNQVVNGDAGNVVDLGAGTSATVSGAGTVGLEGANDNLTLDTSGVTLDSVSGATGETLSGSGFTLQGTAGEFTGTVIGSNNVFNLDANSNSSLTLDGANENVLSTGNTVVLGTSDSSGTITGSAVDVTVDGAGSAVTIGGNGLTATAAQVDNVNFNDTEGGTLTEANDSRVDVVGSNGLILNVGTDADLGLDSGTGQTVNVLGAGSGVWLGGNGQNATAAQDDYVNFSNGVSGTITEFNNSRLDVTGGSSGLTLNVGTDDYAGLGSGTDQTVDVSGAGSAVWLGGNGLTATAAQVDNVNFTDAQGGTLTEVNDSRVDVVGSNGLILNVGTNDDLGLDSGTNQTVDVSGSGSGVWLGGNGQDATAAQDDHVDFSDGESGTVTEFNNSRLDIGGGSSGLTLNLGTDDYAGLGSGTDQTVNITGAGSAVWLGGNGQNATGSLMDTVNFTDSQGGTVVEQADSNLSVGGSAVTVDLSTSDDLGLANGAANDDIVGSNANITGTDITNLTLDGNDDVFRGSADGLDLSGQSTGDDIYLSNTTIDLTGDNSSVDIFGSNDHIVGAADDTFTITGGNDLVDANDSDVYFDGGYGGDIVGGSGDVGSGWSGDYGTGTYGEGGYGSGYAGFTSWKGKSPAASIASQYTGKSGTVYENAAWADKTLTWSFATPAAGSGALLSNAISDPSQQAAVEQAFQAWAQASGLNIEEVAAGKPADIEVGFGDLDTATTNQIGLTRYHSTNGDITGALVELEDPSQSPLTTGSDGQLAYANTDATFEQVALHEIGHALGLGDSDQAGSIMNYLLDSTNTSLGSTDLTGISKLYGNGSNSGASTPSPADASSRQLSQLVQAMASFGSDGMGETSAATEDLDLYKPQLAVALHAQAA